jgi:RimJ/RimL family protein N-acetyltransferase
MSVERASEADIPAIMEVERMPGFEQLVGRWDHAQHAAEMAKPNVRYFVLRRGDSVDGFALLQGVGNPDGRVHLKRIAVRNAGSGDGSHLLREALRTLYSTTDTNRVDLDVHLHNDRAKRAYEKAGFVTEGTLREFHRRPDGTYADMWLMSILRREWEGRSA